ncbi:ribonuclease Z [Candidatus Woesearchaeota archaeon]|nr:ribonuclease Z [Candidatus Woesearchaeota archaeon]
MEIIFLGTSCMVPTEERNHSSFLIEYNGEYLMFDCGEGTQRQLKAAKIKPGKLSKIFITHWHGDHVLGLPGLMQSLAFSEYEKTLEIYVPRNTKKYFDYMVKAFIQNTVVDYAVTEIKDEKVLDTKGYRIEALALHHSIECLGFSFVEKDRRRINLPFVKKLGIPQGPLLGKLQNNKEILWKGKKVSAKDATKVVKGKKIAYITDTLLCSNCHELAKDSDVLICDATYASDLEEKAKEYKHLTAMHAAQIASQNKVRRLIITHFSQRYKTADKILEEAKSIFPNTVAAYDFMKVKL